MKLAQVMKKAAIMVAGGVIFLAADPAGAAVVRIADFVDIGFEGPHTSPNQAIPTTGNLNNWTEQQSFTPDYYQTAGGTAALFGGTAPAAAEGNSYLAAANWNNSASWNGIQTPNKVIPLVPGNVYDMGFMVSYLASGWVGPYDHLTIKLYGEDALAYGEQSWYFVSGTTPVGQTTTTLTANQWTPLSYSFTYTGTAIQYAGLDINLTRQDFFHSSLLVDLPEPASLGLLALGGLGVVRRRRN